MNKLIQLFYGLIISLLFSCSAPEQTAGGSDLPNGIVSGIVTSSSNASIIGASITLTSILLTPHGDSTISKQQCIADTNGSFEFPNVAIGSYVVTASLPNGEKAVLSRVTTETSALNPLEIETSKPITIMGHVITKSGTHAETVYVPGTGISAKVDASGAYVLKDVPTGDIELSIGGAQQINVLQVSVVPTVGKSAYTLRDCEFTNKSVAPYGFHKANGSAFETYPVVYLPSEEPSWYKNTDLTHVDFTGIDYKKISVNDTRKHWSFSTIVEITPAVLTQFGGSMDSVKRTITSYFDSANRNFSDSRFTGKIIFSPDSFTTYSSSSSSATPPSGFSLRVIFNTNTESISTKEWQNNIRTGVVTIGNTILSKKATTTLQRVLALSRGAVLVNSTNAGNHTRDTRGSTGFCQPSLLMWGADGQNWDLQTTAIINKNGDQKTPSFTLTPENITVESAPNTLTVEFSLNGAPLANATINVFPLRLDGVLANSQSYNLSTDAFGRYTFPEDPYQVYINKPIETQYANLKVIVEKNGNEYIAWIPAYEVRGRWLTDKQNPQKISISF